jgi:hypothetical protein
VYSNSAVDCSTAGKRNTPTQTKATASRRCVARSVVYSTMQPSGGQWCNGKDDRLFPHLAETSARALREPSPHSRGLPDHVRAHTPANDASINKSDRARTKERYLAKNDLTRGEQSKQNVSGQLGHQTNNRSPNSFMLATRSSSHLGVAESRTNSAQDLLPHQGQRNEQLRADKPLLASSLACQPSTAGWS